MIIVYFASIQVLHPICLWKMSKKIVKKSTKSCNYKRIIFWKKIYTNLKQLNSKVLGEEQEKMAMRTCLDFDICLTCQHWHLWNKLNFGLNFVFHPEKSKSRLKKYERFICSISRRTISKFCEGKKKNINGLKCFKMSTWIVIHELGL